MNGQLLRFFVAMSKIVRGVTDRFKWMGVIHVPILSLIIICVHTTVSSSKIMHFYIIILVPVALTNFTAFFKARLNPKDKATARNSEKNNDGSNA